MFWDPHDLLLMMGTDIFNTDAHWAQKLTKTNVSFLSVTCNTTGAVKMGKLTTFIWFLGHKMKVEYLVQVILYVKLNLKDILLKELCMKINGFRAREDFM